MKKVQGFKFVLGERTKLIDYPFDALIVGRLSEETEVGTQKLYRISYQDTRGWNLRSIVSEGELFKKEVNKS